MKNKTDTLLKMIEDSYFIEMNLNDTFFPSCSDSERIYPEDLKDLIPLFEKYSYDSINAYFAIMRNYDPKITSNLNDNFYKAKSEIKDLMNSGDFFLYLKDSIDDNVFREIDKEVTPIDLINKLDLKVGDVFFHNKRNNHKVKILFISKVNCFVRYESEFLYGFEEICSIADIYTKYTKIGVENG